MNLYHLPPDRDEYVFVSKHAMDTYKASGKVIHNIVTVGEFRKPLLLVSATRMTYEKGLKRYERMAELLREEGIPFTWLMFTNSEVDIEGVIQMEPTLDIYGYINKADFVVQLSDEESFCYTAVEADAIGTPVITTPLPVLKELKLDFAIEIPFDFKELPRIMTEQSKGYCLYDNTEAVKKWRKLLGNTKPKKDYVPEEDFEVEVKVITSFYDLQEKKQREQGEKFTTNPHRAEQLRELGLVKKGE